MPQPAVKSPRGLTSVRRPIVLTSEVTVDANATKSPDLLKLKNPTGEHFAIREIRFGLQIASGSALITGGAVGAKLDLGSQSLTNAHVPVWSFGRYISRDADAPSDSFHQNYPGSPHFFRWKLRHPLYVPSGASLACEFQHRGTVSSPIVASVTYVGHTLETAAAPSRVRLPWTAAYSSKVFLSAAADSDISSAAALINPFSTPIFLERFTGRLNFLVPGSSVNHAFSANSTLLLKIRHSSGVPLVREFTPFRQVFGAYSHSWEQRDSILDPGTSYLVTVDKLADADEHPELEALQADVGMVGWRDLKLEGGAK